MWKACWPVARRCGAVISNIGSPALFRIRKTLYSLFRDEKAENDWLREPHDALDGQKPIDIMLEGSMENLLLVKEYVEEAAGL